MALDLLNDKGRPLSKQLRGWSDVVRQPISKLNDDAFTRVRIIVMNGLELEAIQFKRACSRMNKEFRLPLADMRRIEQQQAVTINWLLGADHSPLETTIAYEQVAIELTAAIAQNEPDPYLAQTYRYGLLEDFDHLYRYTAMLDRLEGKDSNNIIQSYTDVATGRATVDEHRAPENDLRTPYDKNTAAVISKINALTLVASEQQTWNYYMNIGPLFADPLARQLYAEIAHIEEQHVTQYESLTDPTECMLEKWLLHEAVEVYNYYSCVETETNPRIKAIWEMFLDFELGHLDMVKELFKQYERRDPAEILPATMPKPISYESQRAFVKEVLKKEVDLRSNGSSYVNKEEESVASRIYRARLHEGADVASEIIAKDFIWVPGGELTRESAFVQANKHSFQEQGARI